MKWTATLVLFGAFVFPGAARSAETAPAARAPAVTELQVLPASMTLTGPRDARRFIVRGKTADGAWTDLTRSADIHLHGGAITWDGGFIAPVKDGQATVTVSYAGKSATVPVTVTGQSVPAPVSFATEIMPVLGKTGCNAGTCHGGQKGRNGFKLSLRGYDPDFDHNALVEDIAGRRIDRHTPANSLIILKPTMGVPHEGKLLFEETSRYYRLFHQWIAEGAKSDTAAAVRAERLEVLPAGVTFNALSQEQQIAVIAHFPGGRSRDVTRDANYTSSADTIATVNADGLVKSVRKGEAAVLIRYEGLFAVAPVAVLTPVPGYKWSDPPAANYVDELVYRKLRNVKVTPSELAGDADFLRRVYLDLIGIPPSPEEVRAFLADQSETQAKRLKVIDALLARPEYVDFWTLKWADLMQANRKYLGEKGVWAYRNWISRQVASDRPWDQVARELITGIGGTSENPASAFYRIARDPDQAVETTTHLFLGIRFNCNKCHDHPFERWTQGDYYNLAAFFGQTAIKKNPRFKDDEIVYETGRGDVKNLRTGAVAAPQFPFTHAGFDAKAAAGLSRREQLAAWLTAPENPYFARSVANRLWSHMTGKGIIDPVDDIRAGNPPSNPELLDALAADFVAKGFSIRRMLRTIAASRTYQLSIMPNGTNADDGDNFSHARPRRLTSEQLLDALRAATGTRNAFAGLPVGFRAAQLPDPTASGGGFLEQFGRPVRESPCDCERRNEMSLGQALTLVNGPTVSEAVAAPDGRIAALFKNKPDDKTIVEEIYLAALCRLPTDAERAKGIAALAKFPNRQETAQDLMWALLNTPAFLFNR